MAAVVIIVMIWQLYIDSTISHTHTHRFTHIHRLFQICRITDKQLYSKKHYSSHAVALYLYSIAHT